MNAVTHINPDGLPTNPGFTHAVKVPGGMALVFIGGQNGVDASGNVVSDSADEQAVQALRNVELGVKAAGGSIADVVKWTILVADPATLGPGFDAFQRLWAGRPNPPAVTVQVVAGLANPRYLVEVEAIAAVAS